jgi:protocatechuate 3,4-dioxygenase alpha subunit
MKLVPTPSQTVGPFFSFGLERPAWADLTRGGKAEGEKIRIEGRILDGDGAPVPDALIEIWQADAAGRYAHPEDRGAKEHDRHFHGFGRAGTTKDGSFGFTTVRPGQVAGRGNTLQAPHITFCIFARGLLRHLYTRLYFEDSGAANEADPVLSLIEDPVARRTLIARRVSDADGAVYRFDIKLQGKDETVFFEI